MKNIVAVLFLIFIGFSVQAQETKSKNAKIKFHVSGNCEMCKMRIEKAAFSVSGVKTANWDVDTASLYLIVNEMKTNAISIQKAIANAGHDTEEFKASLKDYEGLPDCCQYERE
ncbi:heavy-metal-associated domain-containing protein [Flavobacterium sp. W20_MBD1_R3]|uniref:heavy-metal-associated domain-containing protein n=1 Tax=Flavobacterium sp. W20_MBD1_R3 TaxID=3240278 RepID=UPI003F8D9A32